MTYQLRFAEDDPTQDGRAEVDLTEVDPNAFRIDERTRAIGRVGIAAAREALAEAVRRAAERDERVAA